MRKPHLPRWHARYISKAHRHQAHFLFQSRNKRREASTAIKKTPRMGSRRCCRVVILLSGRTRYEVQRMNNNDQHRLETIYSPKYKLSISKNRKALRARCCPESFAAFYGILRWCAFPNLHAGVSLWGCFPPRAGAGVWLLRLCREFLPSVSASAGAIVVGFCLTPSFGALGGRRSVCAGNGEGG